MKSGFLKKTGVAIGFAVVACFSLQNAVAQITFVKIADTDTAIPGGTGTFTSFGTYQAVDGEDVAFLGSGDGQQGIYTYIDGTLSVVANYETPIPDGIGQFTGFGSPSIDDGKVAFFGRGGFDQSGLYSNVGGPLHVVADKNTEIPGGGGANFFGFGRPSLDGGIVAFKATDFSVNAGVYLYQGGLSVLVNEQSASASGGGLYTNFGDAMVDQGFVSFYATSEGGQSGMYLYDGQSVQVIADENTAVPGGTGTFTDFGAPPPSLHDGDVVFRGVESPRDGVYAQIDGLLQVVADETTPVPEAEVLFDGFNDSAISGGRVVFHGVGAGTGFGLYLRDGASLAKIIRRDDMLDGRIVNSLLFRREGFSDRWVTFYVTFFGGGRAVYRATLPRLAETTLASAVLPLTRSVEVDQTATYFATVINTGSMAAESCGVSLPTSAPVDFFYQTTDANNNLTGAPDAPVDIAPGQAQGYLLAVSPTAALTPTELELRFGCQNTDDAPVISGLNTVILSASEDPVIDMIALVASPGGIVSLTTGVTGAFAVATINIGQAGGQVTVSADSGDAELPLSYGICETNPADGSCITPVGSEVQTVANAGASQSFAVFPTASQDIPFDPANSRIFIRFSDDQGVLRGASSVAVTTD